MPIYEYECKACGKDFEVFLGIKAQPVEKCIHCKSNNIRKLISNCSFQLKGTGWYLTDYARKDNKDNNNNKEGPKKKEEKPKASESKGPEKKDSGKAA